MGDNDIYFIERILDRRRVNDRLEYKIKWEGYPMSQSTWEPLSNLQTAKELVDEYDRLHPLQNKKLTGNKRLRQGAIKVKKNNNKSNKVEEEEEEEKIKEKKEETEQPKEEEKNEKVTTDEKEKNNDTIDIMKEDNKMKYDIDSSLKRVVTVRKKDNKLIAVVQKMEENGDTKEIEIETTRLKTDNPWILLDFYESKIKFT